MQWIIYDKYMKYNKALIKKSKGDKINDNAENLIHLINRFDLSKNTYSINENFNSQKDISNNSLGFLSKENEISQNISDNELKEINNEQNLTYLLENSKKR